MKHSHITAAEQDELAKGYAVLTALYDALHTKEARKGNVLGTPEGVQFLRAFTKLVTSDEVDKVADTIEHEVEADMALREQRRCYTPTEKDGFDG